MFPCKPSYLAQCKLYKNESMIVPSTKSKNPCTAVFDLKTNNWRKMRYDLREAPINGTLERFIMKDGQEKLLYLGGKSDDRKERSDEIWQFEGNKWKKLNVKMPKAITANATKIFAPSSGFC